MIKIVSRLFLIALLLALMAQSRPAGKVSVAVYPIKAAGAADKASASAITALLSSELTPSPRIYVIEEAMLKTVMQRQAMNISDLCDDTVCQVEIGKLVQAQKLITGDIVKLGQTYILSLKLVDVKTGAMDFSTKDQCVCTEDQLISLVAVAGAKVRNYFGEAMPIPQLPPSEANKTPTDQGVGARLAAPTSGRASPAPTAPSVQEYYLSGTKGGPMVYVSDFGFYIDKYEVTNEEYEECITIEVCGKNAKINDLTAPNQPVVGVDQKDARTYCKWAGKRLPTSDEWIHAAAGTDGRIYPWGNQSPDCSLANYYACGIGISLPVGIKPMGASPYGAQDMAGNVREWVEENEVIRGGSYFSASKEISIYAQEKTGGPGARRSGLGFRCARDEKVP